MIRSVQRSEMNSGPQTSLTSQIYEGLERAGINANAAFLRPDMPDPPAPGVNRQDDYEKGIKDIRDRVADTETRTGLEVLVLGLARPQLDHTRRQLAGFALDLGMDVAAIVQPPNSKESGTFELFPTTAERYWDGRQWLATPQLPPEENREYGTNFQNAREALGILGRRHLRSDTVAEYAHKLANADPVLLRDLFDVHNPSALTRAQARKNLLQLGYNSNPPDEADAEHGSQAARYVLALINDQDGLNSLGAALQASGFRKPDYSTLLRIYFDQDPGSLEHYLAWAEELAGQPEPGPTIGPLIHALLATESSGVGRFAVRHLHMPDGPTDSYSQQVLEPLLTNLPTYMDRITPDIFIQPAGSVMIEPLQRSLQDLLINLIQPEAAYLRKVEGDRALPHVQVADILYRQPSGDYSRKLQGALEAYLGLIFEELAVAPNLRRRIFWPQYLRHRVQFGDIPDLRDRAFAARRDPGLPPNTKPQAKV